jgi:hypothetical protein
MSENAWLLANKRPLTQIRKILVEMEFRSQEDRLPTRQIQQLLRGAEVEILRLQKKLDEIKVNEKKSEEKNPPEKKVDEK